MSHIAEVHTIENAGTVGERVYKNYYRVARAVPALICGVAALAGVLCRRRPKPRPTRFDRCGLSCLSRPAEARTSMRG